MNDNDELMHYGVLGMKWGVRRGRTNATYSKASVKLNRIQDKNLKIQEKMNKKIRQASVSRHPYSRKAMARKASIQKLSRKSIRQMRKAEKWVNKMDEIFADTPINITKEQRDIGAQYAKAIESRTERILVAGVYK